MTEKCVIELIVFWFGICIGSFLNVCIVRLPREESVVLPSSHCMSCNKPLAWYDNVPLLSYLLLGGKCRYCKARYSIRYFLIELLTGLSFVGLYEYYGLSPVLAAYLIMISCFIVATFVDFEHRIIPDEISIGGMFIGLVLSFIIPELHGISSAGMKWMPHVQGLLWSIVGALAGAAPVYLMGVIGNLIIPRSRRTLDMISKEEFYQILHPLEEQTISDLWDNLIRSRYLTPEGEVLESYWKVKKPQDLQLDERLAVHKKKLFKSLMLDTMGGGDVKLMGLIGAFMGWKLSLLTFFFIAPLTGAIYGVIEKIRTKDSTIPYGPFLVLGALISLFYGEVLIQKILNGTILSF